MVRLIKSYQSISSRINLDFLKILQKIKCSKSLFSGSRFLTVVSTLFSVCFHRNIPQWVFWCLVLIWFLIKFLVWQSLVQFYVPFFAFYHCGDTFFGYELESGSSSSLYVFGTVVAEISLIRYWFFNFSKITLFSQFLHLSIETYSWTWVNFVSIFVSVLLFYLFGLVTNILPSTPQGEFYAMCYILAQPSVWLLGKFLPISVLCMNYFTFSCRGLGCINFTTVRCNSVLSSNQSCKMVSRTKNALNLHPISNLHL